MSSILVDTGAWYALMSRTDINHAKAKQFYQERVGQDSFITTLPIVVETWALANARLGRRAAMQFWGMLRETGLPLITPEPPDMDRAWEISQRYPDQDFSLVDCLTFAIMERYGVEAAFTFDRHFLVYRYGPSLNRALTCLP